MRVSTGTPGPRRRRILVAAFACHPGAGNNPVLGGGEGVLGWNLVRQIGRYHDVWVLTCSEDRPGVETALALERLKSIRFHYVDLPGILKPLVWLQGGIQFCAYVWQIKAYLLGRALHERVRFDLFHHVTYANDWMASFLGAFLDVPYVRGPGGGAQRTPRGFVAGYSWLGRFQERLRSVGQWLFRHDPLFVRGQRRARRILVCNQEALHAIPRRWQSKTELFPVNGISMADLVLLQAERVAGHGFKVVSTGKLIRLKGFDLGLRAFKSFLDKIGRTDAQVTYTIIGSGPEQARLQELAQRLAIGHRVSFRPWMPRIELLREIAGCDVFLFPSLRDGGGAVVVEAMAAAKPVICLDLAGPGLHVTKECGIKVPALSPNQAVKQMAEALKLLYEDKDLRSRMGKAGRQRAEHEYHWGRLGDRLMRIYEQALGDGKVRPNADNRQLVGPELSG